MTTLGARERSITLRATAARLEELRTRSALGSLDDSDGVVPLSAAEYLEALALSEVFVRKAVHGRQLDVRAAHAAGASWSQIGAATGMSSRQPGRPTTVGSTGRRNCTGTATTKAWTPHRWFVLARSPASSGTELRPTAAGMSRVDLRLPHKIARPAGGRGPHGAARTAPSIAASHAATSGSRCLATRRA